MQVNHGSALVVLGKYSGLSAGIAALKEKARGKKLINDATPELRLP